MRLTFITLLFWTTGVFAQQYSIGFFAEPSAQFARLLSSNHEKTDSINQLLDNDKGLHIGLEIGIHIDRFNSFYFKPAFYQSGFQLVLENLQLFDEVHPSIPEIRDLSQASTKIAYLHHRFRYVGLEIEYRRDISPKTTNLPVKFSLGGGVGINYLLSQDILLKTEGFAMDGSFKHQLKDSIFFSGKDLMFTTFISGEISYAPEPEFQIYAQARLRTFLGSSTDNEPRVFIWTPGLQIGIRKFF